MGSGARWVSVDELGLVETDQLRDRQSPCFISDYRETDGIIVLLVHLRGAPDERRGLLVRESVAADQEVVEVGPQVLE